MKKNKIVKISLLIVLTSFLLACSNKEVSTEEAADKEVSVSYSSKETSILKKEEETASSEETETSGVEEFQDEIDYSKPYSFMFRDVFGEEHETEIKVGFDKTDLAKEGFSFADGKTLYEDDSYYSRFGIDVSNKQKVINWKKVKEAGVEFAIIRLGYRGYGSLGDIHLDLQFINNIKNAQAEGIDVGIYFFAQAVNEEEALEEAQFVLDNIEGFELQLPIVYDPESILKDTARTDDVSGEQFTKNTIAFCEKIKEAGYEPMIYANMMWQAYMFDMEKLTDYPFWYADYEKYPQTPYAFTMWQYTEKGYVDGINTRVDLDLQLIKKEE